MTSPIEIINLAWQRLNEAKILFQNGMFDGAFYLSGYSVELMLKAKICERIGIPNFFDESVANYPGIKSIVEVRKPFKTHNLFILLIFSGLKTKFDTEKATNTQLAKANSLLFSSWDENARYKPCGHMLQNDVGELITLLSDNQNGLLLWINNN